MPAFHRQERISYETQAPFLVHTFCEAASQATGKPATFAVAVANILIWAVTGPLFDFSDTWQLFINTRTTIVTFLMVFLIQNTQNRNTQALQIKLDELLRTMENAPTVLLDLEELDDEELRRGKSDTGVPEL